MNDAECVMCRRAGEKRALWITDLSTTAAYLNDDQFFPGYTYLILKRHATELYHLTAAERRQMIEEVSVVPRNAEDPNPRWPVRTVPHEPRRLSAEAARERVSAIRAALVQLPG